MNSQHNRPPRCEICDAIIEPEVRLARPQQVYCAACGNEIEQVQADRRRHNKGQGSESESSA